MRASASLQGSVARVRVAGRCPGPGLPRSAASGVGGSSIPPSPSRTGSAPRPPSSRDASRARYRPPLLNSAVDLACRTPSRISTASQYDPASQTSEALLRISAGHVNSELRRMRVCLSSLLAYLYLYLYTYAYSFTRKYDCDRPCACERNNN